MPLINTAVPNLIQGVSQQPDATRFAGQCEEQENALSSVADGLKKRPNTRHIARLITTAIAEDSFVHFINRSDSEKYVVIVYKEYDSNNAHTGCKMRAFNIVDGTEASINSTTGGYALNNSQLEYLHTSSPIDNLKALTIADSTFLLNTSKKLAMSQTRTAEYPKEALVLINQGDYKKDYAIKVTLPVNDSSYVSSDATLTFNMSSTYTTSSYSGGGETVTDRHYLHQINSVTVNDGGSGYTNGVSITIASSHNIYADPTFTIFRDESDGSITSVTVNNGGSFEGQGVGAEDGTAYSTNVYGNYGPRYYDYLKPSLSYSLNQGTATGVKDIVAKFESGEGTDASVANNANTNTIAAGLKTKCNVAGQSINQHTTTSASDKITTYFDVSQHGNLVKLKLKSAYYTTYNDFTLTTIDSLSDTGMTPIYKEVSSITDLPAKCINGFKVKVIGDAELNQDDYFVEFVGTGNAAAGDILNGSWVETTAPNITTEIADDTKPIELVNISENAFETRTLNIAPRTVGSLEGNPNPSFIGSPITNLFFFKSRLGFLSGENIVLSESGFGGLDDTDRQLFNFFRTTTTALLDSDPIDVSVASSRVTNLKAAKGFQENLILFSENGQFVLKGGDVLTPKTVSITPITNFSFEDQVDPLPLGSYIYFPFTRGAFTGMREFTVNASTDNYDSTEVTEHVPAYIPKDIIDMAGTTSEDMIVLLSGDEKGSLYIYNYFWNNNQKVLSAWSKFTFTGEIRGIEFIESTLHAVIVNNGETNLVEMPLESGLTDAAGFVTHLDMRVAKTITNGDNTIDLSSDYTPADNSVEVYTTDGLKLNATNSGATVTLTQAVTADTNVFVGIPYTMKYTFSEQLFKARAGQGSSPSNAAKLMVRNGSIYFDKTAFFKVKVTPKHRDTTENVFTPDIVGSSTLGSLDLDSGFYRFPVFTKAQDTTITIENESALPSNFQSAEFESFLHSRSNRYG